MEIKSRFDHYNFNVLDLEKSMVFYEKALGLKEVKRKVAEDDSFILVYLGDGKTNFTLELTYLKDRTEAYDLGEGEYHLCMRVEGDYDEIREYHRGMGCICYENEAMGLYFISDPDGYWIEILPVSGD
ncbi:VOC family protein [Odoribacter sp. OttesenSCG-928-A06]|nr:VOC family protein [Odoribacter sp. OttesenSCG-928-A06]